jgi:FtsH-binding integral membrane protein
MPLTEGQRTAIKWFLRIVYGLVILGVTTAIYVGMKALLTKQTQPPSFWMGLTWWAAITMIMFAIANALYFLTRKYSKTLHLDAALVFSTFWAVASGAVIILTIFYAFPSSPIQQAHAFLSIAGGCVVGWALGMYISPQDSSERSQFAKIGAAVAGLASGYTIKSIQSWITEPQNHHYQVYCVLAVICALLPS